MANEELVNEIRVRLQQGHDLVEQREDLLHIGYSPREVHDAIDFVIHELRKSEETEEKDVFSFIKPTFSRFILPTIVFILLIIQLYSNYTNIPAIAMDRCKVAEINSKIGQFNITDNFEQAKKEILPLQMGIWNIDRQNIERTRKIMLSNFPVYSLRLSWVNPLYPIPCEKVYFEQSANCRFYSDKENYDCLKSYNDTSFMPTNIEYRKISAINLFISTLVLLFELFIINSLLVIIWKIIKEHTTKRAKQVIEIIIAFAILTAIIAIVYGMIYSLRVIAG